MLDYNFVVEWMRFHLSEENKLICIGWFRENNPKHKTIQCFLDHQELHVETIIKTDIEVRQRYLRYQADINEEYTLTINLPKDWEKKKKFILYTCEEGKKEVSYSIKREKLLKLHQEVNYYIENEKIIDGAIRISGWAMSGQEVQIQLFEQNGQEIPMNLKRNYRRDVMAYYAEAKEDYQAGFELLAETPKENLILIFKDGNRSSEYELNKSKVEKGKSGNSKASLWKKAAAYYQRYGAKAALLRARAKILKKEDVPYELWRRKYQITKEELEAQRKKEFEYNPSFSIVIPLYCTRPVYLKKMLDSVISQTYPNWELCLADGSGTDTQLSQIVEEYQQREARIKYQILEENLGISENTNAAIKMATGDFIVLADHDDIMVENALYECANAINQDAEIQIIYSDEDKIDMDGKKYFEPHFKSDYNLDLLCSMNYICHLFVVKREIIQKVGMLRSEFDGAQDHDFILRCVEEAKNIYHIPKILYHWRCHMDSTAENPESKLYAFEAGRKSVEEHYKRMGIPAKVEHSKFYGIYRTKYLWKTKPLVSIIIPNKDHIEDLKKCMSSIQEKSSYRNFEFIIVENNSTEQETFDYYKTIEAQNVHVVYYDGDFNFSKINNFGATYAKGEYLLLLNNDTEIIEKHCLEELLYPCMREDVGIVGAKLCYEDDTIQHAGVVIGFSGMAGHAFIGQSRYDTGYFSRIITVQDMSAVTAACMMTKKSVFEEVGGLTEELKVAFNDIDYCLKVRELGKLVIYNPYAELYHYESKSRGMEDTPEKIERFNTEVATFTRRWQKILKEGDPYYNPNLTLDKADYSIKL